MKRELRRTLRDLKKGRINKEICGKKERYKEWCERQKKKHKEEEEKKIRNIKCETEAWKYINKYIEKKVREISENIQMD